MTHGGNLRNRTAGDECSDDGSVVTVLTENLFQSFKVFMKETAYFIN